MRWCDNTVDEMVTYHLYSEYFILCKTVNSSSFVNPNETLYCVHGGVFGGIKLDRKPRSIVHMETVEEDISTPILIREDGPCDSFWETFFGVECPIIVNQTMSIRKEIPVDVFIDAPLDEGNISKLLKISVSCI